MEIDQKYTFVSLNQKNCIGINEKRTQDLLSKWGIKGNLVIQHFSFNESFEAYHKYHLADAFFKDESVARQILTKRGNKWAKHGITATSVEAKQIPCTILNMSFFDKLKNRENGIIHNSGLITKRCDEEIDGFLVSDNLRGMLLDEQSDEYNLYCPEDRREFIFRIFQLLVLGGTLCQYEDILDPYLNVTKAIYKDLIRVHTQNTLHGLSVETLVLEVVVKDYQDQAYFPYQPCNKQNVGFLLIDGSARKITTILHQYGGCPIAE